jgi:hypothetical protein
MQDTWPDTGIISVSFVVPPSRRASCLPLPLPPVLPWIVIQPIAKCIDTTHNGICHATCKGAILLISGGFPAESR